MTALMPFKPSSPLPFPGQWLTGYSQSKKIASAYPKCSIKIRALHAFARRPVEVLPCVKELKGRVWTLPDPVIKNYRLVNGLKPELAIFDVGGTMLNYGCLAVLNAFIALFASLEIPIHVTAEEAIGPIIGANKDEHLRYILRNPSFQAKWQAAYARLPHEEDFRNLYRRFTDIQTKILRQGGEATQAIDGISSLIWNMRHVKGMKVVTTTGYNAEMNRENIKAMRSQGIEVDTSLSSEDVREGRPSGHQVQLAMNLHRSAGAMTIVLDDTEKGELEGKHTWTVRFSTLGSMGGKSRAEIEKMSANAFQLFHNEVIEKTKSTSSAHYICTCPQDVEEVILPHIQSRLDRGLNPNLFPKPATSSDYRPL